MINILVVTDDVASWVEKIVGEFSHTRRIEHTSDCLIWSDLFEFHIVKSFGDQMRGACFSCAILDKPIAHELESCVLRPMVKQPILRTKNYKLVSPE